MSKDKFDLSRVSLETFAVYGKWEADNTGLESWDGETCKELQAVIDEARVPAPPKTRKSAREVIMTHFEESTVYGCAKQIESILREQEARIDVLEEVRKAAAGYLVADYSIPVRTRLLHALADYDELDEENGK